jgi:hypothetical protein
VLEKNYIGNRKLRLRLRGRENGVGDREKVGVIQKVKGLEEGLKFIARVIGFKLIETGLEERLKRWPK